MPSIVKPASPTAYLAEAVVRLIIESGILPEGALQLVCASPDELGGLLDCLGGQDSVAFTGSAATAAVLRTHPAVTERAARLNVEADSLNAAVLAPAAVPGTAEFGLFTDEVVKEMTVKAGQKCTAIRRVLVPAQHLDTAAEALAAALSDVVVGDPRDRTSGMGSLVGLAQRHEVAAAVAALREVAVPIVDSCDLSGVDAVAGAFMAPTLLQARDRRSATVHTTEAFGPVSTLMPYSSIDEAIELVAAGGGSLVASLYGPDRDEIATLAAGIASHHGRVLIMDSTHGRGEHRPRIAPAAAGARRTRAGPGAGRRWEACAACIAHMQRTAVQGSPDMLTAVTGEYIGGSATPGAQGPPVQAHLRRLWRWATPSPPSPVRSPGPTSPAFAESTGDKFYAHMDDEAAARSPIFNGLVAHGYLVLSFAAGLFVWPDEGPVLANYGIDRLRFAKPTYPGDEIHVVLTCKRKTQLDGRGYGEVAWDTRVINQHGEVNAAYDVLTMVANAPGINGAPEANADG